VSSSYVSRARSRRQRLGQASLGAQCNYVLLCIAALKAPLLAQVALAPEQTVVQLCQWAQAEHGIAVVPTTMGKTLARFGLTLKNKTLYASEQQHPDVAQTRTDWKAEQPSMADGRLIFLDETWARSNMTPTQGRSSNDVVDNRLVVFQSSHFNLRSNLQLSGVH